MKHFTFLILIAVIASCSSGEEEVRSYSGSLEEEFTVAYSFFTAGHAYGHPLESHVGLHTPFVNQVPYINSYPGIELGVLTGDVVRRSTQAYWDSVQVDIDRFSVPIYIAAGNHDRGVLFESLYPYYQSFTHNDDLFIILSPTNWNIEGD